MCSTTLPPQLSAEEGTAPHRQEQDQGLQVRLQRFRSASCAEALSIIQNASSSRMYVKLDRGPGKQLLMRAGSIKRLTCRAHLGPNLLCFGRPAAAALVQGPQAGAPCCSAGCLHQRLRPVTAAAGSLERLRRRPQMSCVQRRYGKNNDGQRAPFCMQTTRCANGATMLNQAHALHTLLATATTTARGQVSSSQQ